MTRAYVDVTALRSAIGRTLNAAHCARSEWLASGRVRGWGNTTAGYDYDGKGDITPAHVSTYLSYQQGDWSHKRGVSADERNATRDRMLDKYERVLTEAGFTVSRTVDGEKLYVQAEVKT